MTKFSKGDEIECISSLGRIGLGEKFIVIDSRPQLSAPSFHPELVYIEVDGFVRSYSPKHFELVKPATPVFAEGSSLKPIYEQWWGKNKEKSFAQQIAQEGVENMSRDNIVNKAESSSGDPPKKSEWFGYKYQVNPETSKLLQEAVFKDGGRWSYPSKDVAFLDKKHLYVDKYGHIKWGDDSEWFHNHKLPEKQPPKAEALETKKELPTHKHTSDHLLGALNIVGISKCRDEGKVGSCAVVKERPSIEDREFYFGAWEGEVDNLFKQTEEKQTMSNANRRVVNIQLLDNDAGLPVEHALVAEFNGVVTEDNDQTTLQEIISTGEVAERIKVHNEVRSKQLDLAILKSTGQKVNLLPIKLKDLTWNIK